MWGDAERALNLDETDSLSMLLFQISSPAHIPYNDPRWQELLHGYDVWVHVEVRDIGNDHNGNSNSTPQGGVLYQACTSMSKHANNSSNIAALCKLVCQMLHELNPTTNNNDNNNNKQYNQVTAFSERIAIVGKARAVAGALQLLRIFIHRIVIDYANQPSILVDIFTYRNRDTYYNTMNDTTATTTENNNNSNDNNMGLQLLNSLLQYITAINIEEITTIPELYDTTVLAFQLLLVMLSTQLYQPMISSFQQSQQQQQQRTQSHSQSQSQQMDFFLDLIMEQGRQRQNQQKTMNYSNGSLNNNNSQNVSSSSSSSSSSDWTPKSILSTCLSWQMIRPRSPNRSIARYHYELIKSVVTAKGEKVGPDGMYENNLIVSASSPSQQKSKYDNGMSSSDSRIGGDSTSSMLSTSSSHQHQHQHYLLDATRGVLVHASSIIMLPFRLVSLALGLWGMHNKKGYEQSRKHYLQSGGGGTSRTRDVLWITESPVADLASSLFLLLTNNRRALVDDGREEGIGKISNSKKKENDNKQEREQSTIETNPFRRELSALSDNRWESGHDSSALPDLPDPLGQPAQLNESLPLLESYEREQQQQDEPLPGSMIVKTGKHSLTLNFETLFLSFGSILHTEVGALLIYTLLQSSKAFAETIAVRSDLDTLVLPLLRTLYFSSSSRHVSALDFQAKSTAKQKRQEDNKSYGTNNNNTAAAAAAAKTNDANTLLSIPTCPFRSQSQLYLIVILLLLFSQDPSFGPDAFRRTMVATVPWYKERYLKEISLGSVMLLTILRSLTFNLNRLHDMFLLSNCCAILMNLSHSVCDLHEYAAMRLASVTVSCLKKYVAMSIEDSKNNGAESEEDEGSLLNMYSEVSHTLLALIKHSLAQKTIDRNLHLVYALVYHQADFKKLFSMKHAEFKKSEVSRIHNVIKTCAKIIESQSNARTATKALQILNENMDQIQEAVAEKRKKNTEKEDFLFTYEEESDPEIFFIPYIWEVTVCAVTASSVEWDRNKIQVFPLLEVEEAPPDIEENVDGANAPVAIFANDVMDVV